MLPAHQHRTRQLSHLPSLRLPNFPTSRQVEKLASWQVGTHQRVGESSPRLSRLNVPPPPAAPLPGLRPSTRPYANHRSRSPTYPAGRPNAAKPPTTSPGPGISARLLSPLQNDMTSLCNECTMQALHPAITPHPRSPAPAPSPPRSAAKTSHPPTPGIPARACHLPHLSFTRG